MSSVHKENSQVDGRIEEIIDHTAQLPEDNPELEQELADLLEEQNRLQGIE